MAEMHFSPEPETPVGRVIGIPDPDTGKPVLCVIASDGFEVEVTADDISRLPGFGLYVPDEDRAIFGFLHGLADVGDGTIFAHEVLSPTFISRHEAPLSIPEYDVVLRRTLETGRFIVANGIAAFDSGPVIAPRIYL